MLDQLRQLTEKICLERPGTDLSFWRSAYLELQGCDADHLSACYLTLLETLLRLESKPLIPCVTNAGMPLLSFKNGPMCDVAQAKEIAYLWQWIGHLRKDTTLQMAGARAEKFIDQLKAYPGLWSRESSQELPSVEKRFSKLDLAPSQMPGLQDPELGLCVHEDHGLKIALTAVGQNSGFGSIIRDDVGISSFGPSFWPKAEFGMHLAPTDLNALADHKPLPGYHVGHHGPVWHYAAWSRIISSEKHLWCELSAFCKQDIHLSMRCLDLQGASLSMLLAVRADALKVGHQLELASRSLKQYKGEAKTVALEGKNSQMVIIPVEQGKMEIIPLAGDSKYWGADFLLIYPLEGPHLDWNIY